MSNVIEKRVYIAVKMELKTPLSVSNGKNDNTDADVLRNGKGDIFIPGTSVAGAIRDFIEQENDVPGLMGFSKHNSEGDDGRMSSVFVSDAFFEGTPLVTTRDGVKLGPDKIVEDTGKFDMEIIETGAIVNLYLEYIKREKDGADYSDELVRIIAAINNGQIRFGAKKNRGFGFMTVINARRLIFSKDSKDEWLEMINDWKRVIFDMGETIDFKSYSSDSKYVTMTISLKQLGGISIRVYSAAPGKADYSHITCNGKPVIPGSSWNGAIRSRALEILQELGKSYDEAELILKKWFGNVRKKKGDSANQSDIVYQESVINDAVKLSTTRNKIDRFDFATVGTALYTEESYYNGQTALKVMIRKKKNGDEKALVGLMMLLMDEISCGYISVGGQTAVGKGIFAECDNDNDDYGSGYNREECLDALYSIVA
jgi:CRISPR/Cas system CSM-associated protein Csm3 (group 7 of RAMP superfamily)